MMGATTAWKTGLLAGGADYLMVRIDPDKVTPLRSEAQSHAYLSKPSP